MKKYFLSWMWLLVMGSGVQAQVALPLSFREKQELKTNSWVSETPFERVPNLLFRLKMGEYGIQKTEG